MVDGSEPPPGSQRASNAPDPLIGRLINGRFRIVSTIARGGMGKVYRAEQEALGRVCALKVLNPSYAGDNDPEFAKRFFLEASIAAKLTHQNTVTVFDYGRTDDDVYFMAMELLEGMTLHAAIHDAGPLGEERSARIARQVCRSLREAHALGVIHRDMKPANIFLVAQADEPDFVNVLDFGLVKAVDTPDEDVLTRAGLFMGSPKYMSPEQIRGERVDARTDIYSLGVVMYEMVTGKPPFTRTSSVNVLMAHISDSPPPLRDGNALCAVSPAFEAIIFRCLSKDPADRFASMSDLLLALKHPGIAGNTGAAAGTGEYRALTGVHSDPPPTQAEDRAAAAPRPLTSSGSLDAMATGDRHSLRWNPRGRASRAAIACACLALGVAGFWLAHRTSEHAKAEAARATQATLSPPVSASDRGAPRPALSTLPGLDDRRPSALPSAIVPSAKSTSVRIETDPPGASVRARAREGGELCGSTPCDVVFADDANDAPIIYLVRRGYVSEARTVAPGETRVVVRLTPIVTARPQMTTPNGFKPAPY